MIIVNLKGGLGNQMFQYSFARALSIQYNVPIKVSSDTLISHNIHNGLELDRVFNIKIQFASSRDFIYVFGFPMPKIFRIILTHRFFQYLRPKNYISDCSLDYDFTKFDSKISGFYLNGYFQSEDYFFRYKEFILKDYQINISNLSLLSKQIVEKINSSISVGLHVRRGDYLSTKLNKSLHNVLDLEYYSIAVDYLRKRLGNFKIIIFTDDIEWVEKNLLNLHSEIYISKGNLSFFSYLDLYLMSLCDHNIIANSTFSWWGAWLNRNDKKIVIAPSKWFMYNYGPHNIVPNNWVII